MTEAHHVHVAEYQSPLTGKLSLDVVPWHDTIVMTTVSIIILGSIVLAGFVTYKKFWGPLWRDWLCSVDHKKIGIMYIILAIIMLFRGFADALMMTSQQASAMAGLNGGEGYLPPEHFDQIFTAHGVIMIFFVATPLFVGLANYIVPMQIGARDMAYPFLNLVSLWFTIGAVVLINLSLFIGRFAATGWVAYPPLSGIHYSPDVGVDYWIWSLQLSGLGTTFTAINFLATIIKMRAPGMGLMKMPVFTWTIFCTFFLAVVVFPILTVAIAMLTLDRYAEFHFFTGGSGGNQGLWVNLLWAWGHPEVYFLVLPAFGMISEVVATFSKKRLFGYGSLIYATIAITGLSFVVWLHHFFTMGSGASVNAFFGVMTMIIAIPTGVKLYNWIFTMYKGRVIMSASMWWVVSMLLTFTVGGMTGVMLSIPTNDYVVHNSLFLVAHFHNTIIGGAVYGYFAGLTFWWPKMTGFKLNETLGKWSAGLWFVGFFVAWMPKYLAGFDGMTRRLYKVTDPAMAPYLYISFLGALIILAGIAVMIFNFWFSYINRNKPEYADLSGDPWDARTLEWYGSSPPSFYNFAVMHEVSDRDEFDYMKKQGTAFKRPEKFEKIHMPTPSWQAPLIGIFGTACAFALIWHVWWLAIVGFLGVIGFWFARSFSSNKDYYVQVEEIEKIENKHYDNAEKAMQDPAFKVRPEPVTVS